MLIHYKTIKCFKLICKLNIFFPHFRFISENFRNSSNFLRAFRTGYYHSFHQTNSPLINYHNMSEVSDIADKWLDDIHELLDQLKMSSVNTLDVAMFNLNTVLSQEHKKLDTNQKDMILMSILSTYRRYPFDSKFNKLVLQAFENFIKMDAERYSKNIIAFIAKHATKPIALRDLLVLINWNNEILVYVQDKEFFASLLKVSVSTSITLIALITDHSQIEKLDSHHTKSITSFKSTIISVFKKLMKSHPETINSFVEFTLIDKLPIAGIISILGLITLAASEGNPDLIELLKLKEVHITEFFAKVGLATKVSPNPIALQLLKYS